MDSSAVRGQLEQCSPEGTQKATVREAGTEPGLPLQFRGEWGLWEPDQCHRKPTAGGEPVEAGAPIGEMGPC